MDCETPPLLAARSSIVRCLDSSILRYHAISSCEGLGDIGSVCDFGAISATLTSRTGVSSTFVFCPVRSYRKSKSGQARAIFVKVFVLMLPPSWIALIVPREIPQNSSNLFCPKLCLLLA